MHKRILMTYLFIAGQNMVDPTWITKPTTYELFSSAYPQISCMLMRQNAYLMRTRSHFWDALLGSEDLGRFREVEGHSKLASPQEPKGSAQVAWPCQLLRSIVRITLIWLGHCPIFLKRMWSGSELATKKSLLRP